MSIALFSIDLERKLAKYTICKVSFFVPAKSQSDNFAITCFCSGILTFSLKLGFAKC